MPNEYLALNVPAGDGVGTTRAFVNRAVRTVIVTGTFTGLVVIEGSDDGTNFAPLLTFNGPDFKTILPPLVAMRVRRKGTGNTPGTPGVTVGSSAELVTAVSLPPPAGLNGEGAAVDVLSLFLENVFVGGPFSLGQVVYVEISHDGGCWVELTQGFQRAGSRPVSAAAAWARQRVSGRPPNGLFTPAVVISGPTMAICAEDIPLPAGLNGFSAAVDVSGCGPLKTFTCNSTSGAVPCTLEIQGSNDDGVTWVPVVGFNTAGMRQVLGVFQFLRTRVSGLLAAEPGLCAGVSAPESTCDDVTLGDWNVDFSSGGI